MNAFCDDVFFEALILKKRSADGNIITVSIPNPKKG